MAAIALPWFVLVTTGSAARMGFVMAAEFLGMAVLGIPSGRAATALGPRRTLLVSDLARAGLIALIPLLHWAGTLTFPVLVAVGFAVGAFFPAYSSSQLLVMAGVLSDDERRMTRLGGLFGSSGVVLLFRTATIGPQTGTVTAVVWTLAWSLALTVVAAGLYGRFDRVFADLI
jgi:MFS family permease